MKELHAMCQGFIDQGMTPALQCHILQNGKEIFSGSWGKLSEDGPATNDETRFDMASVTKLYVSVAFAQLVEKGLVEYDQPVCTVLPKLSGMRPIEAFEWETNPEGWVRDWKIGDLVDAGKVTFRDLLTHTSGIGPRWLFLADNQETMRELVYTAPFDFPIGKRYLYSCMGLCLVGWAMEKLTGTRLDRLVEDNVCKPLGLGASYLPVDEERDRSNIAATEWCRWRKRRIQGYVHDENAYGLNGVAGNAGIFSTAKDVAAFGQSMLDAYNGKQTILSPEMVREMAREQIHIGYDRRGLGFQLRLEDPEAHTHALSVDTFGHTGYTGTCVWMDPQRQLTIAVLTNEVYNGRENRQILKLRRQLFDRLVEIIG